MTAATTCAASWTPDHGRIVDAAVAEARDALFHDGQVNVSWADALVEIAHRSLDGGAGGAAGTVPGELVHRPGRPIPARFTDGFAVPDWLRDQLLCDGTVDPGVHRHGRPVSVGRTQHQVPTAPAASCCGADRKCRVPWCGQTRWLQVHHIIHDHHHGPTDTWNLTALCPADHRLHHQGLLGITGNADDPDGLTFTDAHGRVIDPATRPIKPTGPPPAVRPNPTNTPSANDSNAGPSSSPTHHPTNTPADRGPGPVPTPASLIVIRPGNEGDGHVVRRTVNDLDRRRRRPMLPCSTMRR